MAASVGSDLGWDRTLRYRPGGPTRLDGLDVFYDFKWFDVFRDGRAQFKNGQCLARLVRADCPAGKRPGLLLTTRGDVEERPIETDTRFVMIVNLPRYLAHTTPDAAASYYAHHLDSGITNIARLHELAAQPDVIQRVIESELNAEHISAWAADDKGRIEELRKIAEAERAEPAAGTDLDIEHIAAWAAEREDRIEQLREIAGRVKPGQRAADLSTAINALTALEGLDADVVLAIERLLGKEIDRETLLRFLRILTANPSGRSATSEVFGERIADRLADARATTDAYSALLGDPDSNETDLQNFIEAHPWLLGLDYVHVRPRKLLPRGQMDFILERYNGFHDLLELKSPQDPIVTAPDLVDGVPPPANSFALSPALAQALAQIHVYRDILSTDEQIVEKLYGIPQSRNPRVMIVIGQAKVLPEHRARVLRDLNHTLHRVEVVPYDWLADRATTLLNNVERHLAASKDAIGGAGVHDPLP